MAQSDDWEKGEAMVRWKTASAWLSLIVVVGCSPNAKTIFVDHDFALMQTNTVASHTFAVPNESDDVWMVDRIIPSCGCASVTIDSRTVLPQETLRATVEYEAPSEEKDDRQHALLRLTTDGETKQIVMRFRSAVRKQLSPSKGEIELKKSAGAFVGFAEIRNFFPTPMEFKLNTSTDELIAQKTMLPSSGDVQQYWRIKVTGRELANIKQPMFVELKSELFSLKLPITVKETEKPYSVFPSELLLFCQTGESVEKKLDVVSLSEGHSIPEVSGEFDKNVAASITKSGRGRWTIRVVAKPDVSGEFRGEVLISKDSWAQRIPVSIFVE